VDLPISHADSATEYTENAQNVAIFLAPMVSLQRQILPCVLLVAATVSSAYAQIDFAGEWTPLFHEDNRDRLDGPHLGDYAGLPLNDAARFMAEAWDADILSVPEHQCRPHPADYGSRGPADMRMWKEVDKRQQIIAWHIYIWWQGQERTIWMDGRPHPDEFAPHTFQGFSTGSWEGPVLKVRTTHLKKGYLQRNGVPRSDQAEVMEYFYRRGDFLTWTTIINDSAYLTEPMIRTSDFRTAPTQDLDEYDCRIVTEIDKPHGWVPHVLPGSNKFVDDYAQPGGSETAAPEYRKKLVKANQ